jgi:hypothetical protein
MRRAVLVSLAVALVALVPSQSSAKRVPRDPGRVLVAGLLSAATRHDAKGLWSLLSTPSQRRLGPTFAAFRASAAGRIERSLVPFENRSVVPFISQSLSARFGIVAIHSGSRALAFPLRREDRSWRIETPGPIQIRILGPQPGSRGRVAQIGVEASAPAPIGDAVIFVDGRLYPPKLVPAGRISTIFVTLPKALRRGTHIGVAYAEQGSNVSAIAWTFTATSGA